MSDEAAILLHAHRAEFLHECVTQGMTAEQASDCLDSFEREALADDPSRSTRKDTPQ